MSRRDLYETDARLSQRKVSGVLGLMTPGRGTAMSRSPAALAFGAPRRWLRLRQRRNGHHEAPSRRFASPRRAVTNAGSRAFVDAADIAAPGELLARRGWAWSEREGPNGGLTGARKTAARWTWRRYDKGRATRRMHR